MRAAVFDVKVAAPGQWLTMEDVPRPEVQPGQVLLKVLACGVCRTDLHIVEGDLPAVRQRTVPGHQIVGEVVDGATADLPAGTRAGVSWIGGVDGDCRYCRHGMENLCDGLRFHRLHGGWRICGIRGGAGGFCFPAAGGNDGEPGSAAVVRGDHWIPQPAGGGRGKRRESGPVWVSEFGVAGDPVLQAWECEVYVLTRGENRRRRGGERGDLGGG